MERQNVKIKGRNGADTIGYEIYKNTEQIYGKDVEEMEASKQLGEWGNRKKR